MNYDQHQVALGLITQHYETLCRRANAYARNDRAVKHLVDERYAELDRLCDAINLLEANTIPAWLFAAHSGVERLRSIDAELTGTLIRIIFKPGVERLASLTYDLYARPSN